MGRPLLPVGTYGKIRVRQERNGSWTARAAFRDYDGVTRDVERTAETKAAAERRLKEALRDRAQAGGGSDLNGETKVKDLAEKWWQSFIRKKDRSPTTVDQYQRRLANQIIPALGELRIRELTTGRVEKFLQAVEDHHGSALAKMNRTVLSNMCAYAAQHDALDRNPVRDTSAISVKPRKAPRALTLTSCRQLLAYMTYDAQAIYRDLIVLAEVMAATGLRVGEALALQWRSIDFAAGTLAVQGTVIRKRGEGLLIKRPKTAEAKRVLVLPTWCVRSLELRHLTAAEPDDPPTVRFLLDNGQTEDQVLAGDRRLIFPSRRHTPRDPSNVEHQLKDAFHFSGEDITSHVFRKTVATAMDQAGLSARAAADQLGHAQVSLTENTYFGRKIRQTGAADVLEALAH